MVTPENIFNEHHNQPDDILTTELKQLMQEISRHAYLLLSNMHFINGVITKKTEQYQNYLLNANEDLPEKIRTNFIDIALLTEKYRDHIRQYHELLETDNCSYQIPFWAYKQLRHQLVLRVLLDIRSIQELIVIFSQLHSENKYSNLLKNRWQRELINFVVLAN